MVKEYTISELADILKISKQATDKKIKKLEVGGLKTTIKSINNRPTKIVFLNNDQLNDLMNNTLINQLDQPHDNQPYKFYQQPEQPTNQQLLELVAPWIEKASKYELLEDKQKELKEDTKYWQNKFFESQNEAKELIKLNAQLEIENQQLKQQLSKKWWRIGK